MIIFPGLIGAVAISKSSVAVPRLDLQISTDYAASWQDGPVNDYSYFAGTTKSYDIRAVGIGTESIDISNSNGNFAATLSSYSITGNAFSNIQLYVNYSGFGSESSTITIYSQAAGGDSITLNVYS